MVTTSDRSLPAIVHMVWSLGFGGIETMLVNIANAQVRMGAKVSVMIINDAWEPTLLDSFDKRVRMLFVHKKAGSGKPWFLLRLNRMLQRERPDVVHLHGSGSLAMIFSRRLSRVACCTLHDLPHGVVRRSGWLYRLFPILDIKQDSNVLCIDRVPQVFAISQAVHDELLKNYGVESTVVPNGIVASAFRARGDRPAGSPLRMVMVSRLDHEKKGQDLLIEAVAALKGKVTVDFIGIGGSMEFLKQLTADKGAEAWVRFLGKRTQPEVRSILADYDLFVQPSRYEGFGLTVAEAMAAGVPVLVSAGQGPAEVTCGDKYGWTFENGNVEELTGMIRYITEHFSEALDKAELAVEHVRNTYDVSVTAKKYIEEYMRITDTSNVDKYNVIYRGGGKTK